jgi:hypothetical protein
VVDGLEMLVINNRAGAQCSVFVLVQVPEE